MHWPRWTDWGAVFSFQFSVFSAQCSVFRGQLAGGQGPRADMYELCCARCLWESHDCGWLVHRDGFDPGMHDLEFLVHS